MKQRYSISMQHLQNISLAILISSCGVKGVPENPPPQENQCVAVTTCNIDDYSKVGPAGLNGDVGPAGPAGKDAPPMFLESSISCGQIFAGYLLTYSTKLFSNNLRFNKCSAMSTSTEYVSSNFDVYGSSEPEYMNGGCYLYGAVLDCHDPTVGVWKFYVSLKASGYPYAVYVDPTSSYNNTVVQFSSADCSVQ